MKKDLSLDVRVSKNKNVGYLKVVTCFDIDRTNWRTYSDTPGPGQYYIPVTVADVPRYVMPIQNEKYKWV